MTFDIKALTVCDHLVRREQYLVDPNDYQILKSRMHPEDRIERPIANPKTELRRNGWVIPVDHPKYGYSLVNDPNSVAPERKKMVLLNRPAKSLTDVYELNYYVNAGNCRKCTSLRILTDMSLGPTGKINTVEFEDKLLQHLYKYVLTVIHSNPFHPWLGTSLISLIGSKISKPSLIISQINREVNDTLVNLKKMQTNQLRYQSAYMDTRELLLRILSVSTTQNRQDPTLFDIQIVVQTIAGSSIEFQRRLRIPGPDNLNLLFSGQGRPTGSDIGTPPFDF